MKGMHVPRPLAAVALCLSAALGVSALDQTPHTPPAPGKLTVYGLDGTAAVFTVADLEKLPLHTLDVIDHDKPATFEGVALSDLLAKVALPTGEKYHKTGTSYYLLVEAKDGYRALFAWAELDSSFMDKPVYVAIRRDGKPLSAKEGPFRIVAPGEKRPARWVWGVVSLKIRQAG
jgi:hypothetical protein